MSSLTEIAMGFAEDEYKIAKTSSVFSKSANINSNAVIGNPVNLGRLKQPDEAIIYLTGERWLNNKLSRSNSAPDSQSAL